MREIMEVPALRRPMSEGLAGGDGVDVPSGGIKALDELLDLPHLNVLLRGVLTHLGSRNVVNKETLLYRDKRRDRR